MPPHPAHWKSTAETVASRLNHPFGLFVDEDQVVYVADYKNYRIVASRVGAVRDELLAGGNGRGSRLDQLDGPTDIIVDRETDSLLVCDAGNRRVMRWPHRRPATDTATISNGEILIDHICCYGLTMDDQGALYVSDDRNHEVRRYDKGGKDKQGTVVAGSNGAGTGLHQLNEPTYLCVDSQSNVYVSDTYNHRVVKWMKGATEGIVVAGGNGDGSGLAQLSRPKGVWVSGRGHIYVADTGNHRVMRWEKGAKEGTLLVGRNGRDRKSVV